MNQQQAEAVVAVMTGQVWTTQFMELPQKTFWVEYLVRYSSDDAIEAVKALARTSKFFPSISEFEDVIKPIVHFRMEQDRSERAALDAAPKDRMISAEKTRESLAKIREMIEEARIGEGASGTHEHTGETPNQCPSCRVRWNLPAPGSTDLPACPSCGGKTVEHGGNQVPGLRYYCVDCDLFYNGSYEEMVRYRDGTALPRTVSRVHVEDKKARKARS